jgi:Putative zinc-finger
MKHSELSTGDLRAYLDGQIGTAEAEVVKQHVDDCRGCQTELQILKTKADHVRAGLERLPQWSCDASATWAAFQRKREELPETNQNLWSAGKIWYLSGGALAAAALIVVFTVGPVRAWAENLLAIFRVEHFSVLELNPTTSLKNNQLLNQTVSHIISDEVTVTEAPQKPQSVADAATAIKLAGFQVKLLTEQTPSSLFIENGLAAHMKINRDRLQEVLDEAGRNDLQIPSSVDGATVSLRIPTGVLATYGNCGDTGARLKGQMPENTPHQQPDATCIALMELPSPVVTAPPDLNPAQIAQVALQFLGMSANDAANFTQTVDWTSTLVLPVLHGQSTYQQIPVNGNEGVLLRSKAASASANFALIWVDSGIVYGLHGNGDDTTALNLASQLK